MDPHVGLVARARCRGRRFVRHRERTGVPSARQDPVTKPENDVTTVKAAPAPSKGKAKGKAKGKEDIVIVDDDDDDVQIKDE